MQSGSSPNPFFWVLGETALHRQDWIMGWTMIGRKGCDPILIDVARPVCSDSFRSLWGAFFPPEYVLGPFRNGLMTYYQRTRVGERIFFWPAPSQRARRRSDFCDLPWGGS
jgi:hypothetical protein